MDAVPRKRNLFEKIIDIYISIIISKIKKFKIKINFEF
jgi:hypothetical protein